VRVSPKVERIEPRLAMGGDSWNRIVTGRRIVFDLSTTVRWTGPPSGIIRVERELGLWALRHIPDVTFAAYDPTTRRFDAIDPSVVVPFLTGNAATDYLGHPDPNRPGRHRTEAIPRVIRPAALWLLQFRRKLIQALERRRLRTRSEGVAAFLDRLQRRLITRKYRRRMLRADGGRRAFVPYDMVHHAPMAFSPGDVLVCTGAGWVRDSSEAILALQVMRGVQFVLLCHDIIPLLMPQHYSAEDAASFAQHVRATFAMADVVIFTSWTGEAHARAYCEHHGIRLRAAAVSSLGTDPPESTLTTAELPPELQDGGYALLVSTIEPRKGHRMIYEIWLRLLHEGVPQSFGFKLVFVGRSGWLVDDLMHALRCDLRIADSLYVLEDVGDERLERLYRGAAFCLYPSLYEGYGLPVVEAFLHGKPVLASTGGAVPEIVGEFSPCLDPNDVELWHDMLRHWIVQPSARTPYEAAIRQRYRHPTWAEAAAGFFATVEATLPAQSSL
jgi:glycosyltransferase involved in cell wall biosynthesis